MQNLLSFESKQAILPQANDALTALYAKTCKGNDFLGRIDRPTNISTQEIQAIQACANRLRKQSQVIVVIGIWGSYLGAKAVIDAFTNPLQTPSTRIVYAGHHMDDEYHAQLLSYLSTVDYSLIVISKSGTTTEPKIAFDLLRKHAEQKYGAEAKNRIVAITDVQKWDLRPFADAQWYESFVIPDDIGGRFSVFTPCGLLPIACAGIDVAELVAGAREAKSFDDLALHYASVRYALYTQAQKTTEILVSFTPFLTSIGGRRQQLFWESEGKDGTGVLPISLQYSTDLHSMGQYVQEGQRNLMETFVWIGNPKTDIGLRAYNTACMLGTKEAHEQGNVPVALWTLSELTPYCIGLFLAVMMKSCGISALMLGVNPFDQPGVEAYKKAMKQKLA